jgi:hypothetical protein
MDYGVGSAPEPKHVDRKLLYTSLEERIKYLHHFLDFNSGKFSPWTIPSLDTTTYNAQVTSKHS